MVYRPQIVSLDQLYLDPNNYRFVDQEQYGFVSDSDLTTSRVQSQIQRILQGESLEGVLDLVNSFKSNGFLEFEQIQVREVDDNRFVVVEGNRRVATLKYLKSSYEKGSNIGLLSPEVFTKLPVTLISGLNGSDHLIAMGLQHIGGKKKWSPLNQAKLLQDLLEKNHMPEDSICFSLGISKQALRKSQRVLSLIEAYRASDFGDQFRSDKFSFFEEIIKSSEIKQWLEWDDSTKSCLNKKNQERIFNWLSFVDTDGEERLEPILTRSADIRRLSTFISDSKAISIMEETRSFTDGLLSSNTDESKVKQRIERVCREVDALVDSQASLTRTDFDRIREVSVVISKMTQSNSFRIGRASVRTLVAAPTRHFSTISIGKYRGLHKVHLEGLSRLNLFVGDNNCGKSSMLEAIYLLSQMNNINKYLEIEQLRAKIAGSMSSVWIAEYIDDKYEIAGIFDNKNYRVSFEQYLEENLDFDKDGYITSIRATALSNNSDTYSMLLHLYDTKDKNTHYNEVVQICPSGFSSAYCKNNKSLLDAHRVTAEKGAISELTRFIRENFDSEINEINLVGDDDNYRFIINSSRFENGVDISKYGEGMQRVLEISLYVVANSGGCVFVDEIDSAIHKSLLDRFITYIDRLCEKYDVQLFTSTHNKECVDSFVALPSNIYACHLERKDSGEIVVTASNGGSLKPLVDNFNLDIR